MKRYWITAAAVLLLFCGACGYTGGWENAQPEPNDPIYGETADPADTYIPEEEPEHWIDEEELPGMDDPVTRREVMELILDVIGAVPGDLAESALDHQLVYAFDEAGLDEPATRLETAQMAARALWLLPIVGESPYTDCSDGYVVKLREKGLWGEGDLFRPDDAVLLRELSDLLRNMERTDLSVQAFKYAGYWVEELDGVPLNEYELTDFAMGTKGVTYESEDYTVLRGIDVSEFQNTVNWKLVKADGIDFVIVRVGGRLMQSGTIFEDKRFHENVQGALAAGLKVGVYFFSQAITEEEGLEEAEFVLSLIKDYDLDMPVVMDWERLGGTDARTYGVGADKVTAAALAFCGKVEEAGYTPMIYMNSYCGYTKFDLRDLTHVELWFAEYEDVPSFRYHFTMWQYSAEGRVKGINGNVDMNLYFVPDEE